MSGPMTRGLPPLGSIVTIAYEMIHFDEIDSFRMKVETYDHSGKFIGKTVNGEKAIIKPGGSVTVHTKNEQLYDRRVKKIVGMGASYIIIDG